MSFNTHSWRGIDQRHVLLSCTVQDKHSFPSLTYTHLTMKMSTLEKPVIVTTFKLEVGLMLLEKARKQRQVGVSLLFSWMLGESRNRNFIPHYSPHSWLSLVLKLDMPMSL